MIPRRLILLTTLIACLRCEVGWTQPIPIDFKQRYDRVVMKKEHGGQSVLVMPLGFSVGDEPDQSAPLRVRVLDYPDREYDVPWSAIKRIEFFEDIVLERVNKYVKAGRFEDAYRLLLYMREQAPDWRRLKRTTENFLMRDALAAFRAGKYDESLTVLDELYRRNNSVATRGLLAVADRIFKAKMEQREFDGARHVMDWIRRRPELRDSDKVAAWQEQLESESGTVLAAARSAFKEEDYRTALDRVSDALAILPTDERALALSSEILKRYPRVAVGVGRLSAAATDYEYDWAFQRTLRLQSRMLVELNGYSSNGGEYAFPLGSLALDDDNRGARFVPAVAFQSSANNLASLLDTLSFSGTDGAALLGRMVESVKVDPNRGVHLRLNREYLRWLPLLRAPIAGASPSLAAYVRNGKDAARVDVFKANAAYHWHERGQPTEVIERVYPDRTSLTQALVDGEVDVVDRIGPAEAEQLRRTPGIRVGQYAFPSAYFLVTNGDRPLLQQRAARRAIAYGIDRPLILKNMLLGGEEYEGCKVISGPFPAELRDRDPLGYAYDTKIAPRKYDPEVALALMTIAREQRFAEEAQANRAKKDAETNQTKPVAEAELPVEAPPLVLACPQDALLTQSAAAIARSLSLAGIKCKVRMLAERQLRPNDQDWDLWLVDVTYREPILDIHQLFGSQGLIQSPSTYVIQSLDELTRVSSWSAARPALGELHSLVHRELEIIPLWQLTNHFAYATRVKGIEDGLVQLYQDVERWRVER